MLTLLLSLTAAAQDCEDPVTPADIVAKTDDAQLAWATLDEDGFIEIVDALPGQIACLDAALAPNQAAAVHRMMALRSFLAEDDFGTMQSVRAATRADPGYTLSDRIAPEGGKLWRDYNEAAKKTSVSTTDLDLPKGWTSWVDGAETDQRAQALPAIVQVGSAPDDVQWTTLAGAGKPVVVPDLGRVPDVGGVADLDGPSKPAKPPKPPKEGSGSGKALWIAAGSTGAVAAGLFGASAGLRSSFDSNPTKGKYTAVNGTFLGSVGMAAVTGGLVTAALVSKR